MFKTLFVLHALSPGGLYGLCHRKTLDVKRDGRGYLLCADVNVQPKGGRLCCVDVVASPFYLELPLLSATAVEPKINQSPNNAISSGILPPIQSSKFTSTFSVSSNNFATAL